jgi:hypothetical protein
MAVMVDWIWSTFTYGRGARLLPDINMKSYSQEPKHALGFAAAAVIPERGAPEFEKSASEQEKL